MQYQGFIENWDDERGFGFVMPDGDEPRTFVHILKFADRRQRPVEGDAIVFNLATDVEGRPQAVNIRFAGSTPSTRSSRPNRGRAAIGLGGLLGIAFACLLVTLFVLKIIPIGVLLLYLGMSVATALIYGQDKVAANENAWRTSEYKLQMLAFLCGWPGALLGQRLFRHKTSKQSFRYVFWIAVVMNCGLFATYLTIVATDSFASAIARVKSSIEDFEVPTFNSQSDRNETDESDLPLIVPGPK